MMGFVHEMKVILQLIGGELLKNKKARKNYTCAASRNTTDRIMVIRAKHTTIV